MVHKTTILTDTLDGVIGRPQQLFCSFHPGSVQIIGEVLTGILIEQRGEIRIIYRKTFRQFRKFQFLITILSYIIFYLVKQTALPLFSSFLNDIPAL